MSPISCWTRSSTPRRAERPAWRQRGADGRYGGHDGEPDQGQQAAVDEPGPIAEGPRGGRVERGEDQLFVAECEDSGDEYGDGGRDDDVAGADGER